MSLFDKLVINLAELYCASNPETIEYFGPDHPTELLYGLFWTLLFIDQEFRNPTWRRKVTCSYFINMINHEDYGHTIYDKKVLKRMYSDIRSRPLLPAPYLITAPLYTTAGATAALANLTQQQQQTDGTSVRPVLHSRPSSFSSFASSIGLEKSFERARRWWRNEREGHNHVEEEGEDEEEPEREEDSDHVAVTLVDTSLEDGSHGDMVLPGLEGSSTLTSTMQQQPQQQPTPSTSRQLSHSLSSMFPQGQSSTTTSTMTTTTTTPQNRTLRYRFGTKSELVMNKQASVALASLSGNTTATKPLAIARFRVPNPIMNQGFAASRRRRRGWHIDGDGLDEVVRFPTPKRPSTLGSKYRVLQCAELMHELESDA
ncbi:hypothetical protein BGZ98_002287 [Dissophora globulifera]|nr:hypothetical protein BGZ98_002287 [Dissophora globulifera]